MVIRTPAFINNSSAICWLIKLSSANNIFAPLIFSDGFNVHLSVSLRGSANVLFFPNTPIMVSNSVEGVNG